MISVPWKFELCFHQNGLEIVSKYEQMREICDDWQGITAMHLRPS
jgi:hypothetical protein